MGNAHAHKRYQELARKRMLGTITPEEAEELAQWLDADDGQPLELPASFAGSRSEQEKRIFRAIEGRIVRIVPLYRRPWLVASAAAVLLCLLVGSYLLLRPSPGVEIAGADRKSLPNDRLPGGNKAVLTLDNGRQIILDSAGNGLLADLGPVQVIKQDNDRLVYQHNTGEQPGNSEVNILSTPRGGQFRIILPDGSQVWLNAASSLKFPTAFNGKERLVELRGQGYFEVAQRAGQPFKVKAGEVNVEVSGTHFDIMAYPDERTVNTTLVEGSVQISEGDKVKRLLPREQVVVNSRQGTMVVQRVNVDKVIAWKNGLFIFNNADLETILREVGRWYDVEIVNKVGNSGELYGGSISRNRNLSDVLKLLGSYGNLDYTIEGSKVTILPR